MENIILIIAILFIPLLAQIKVKSSYNKYMRIKNTSGLSGTEVARRILDNHNLNSVYVVETPGVLSDHYDPRRKTVRLSNSIFEDTTIASVAVAAHECGHAIQDKEGYFFLKLRSMIYPIVNIATSISYYIIFIGFVLEYIDLIYLGIGFSALGLLFQIITLPVEFNASKRAKEEIHKMGIITNEEEAGVSAMLSAAALTYVAGVLSSALQIIRLILNAERRR